LSELAAEINFLACGSPLSATRAVTRQAEVGHDELQTVGIRAGIDRSATAVPVEMISKTKFIPSH
jgi:hypothetical protein